MTVTTTHTHDDDALALAIAEARVMWVIASQGVLCAPKEDKPRLRRIAKREFARWKRLTGRAG